MEATRVSAQEANLRCYDEYYNKPRWWFRLRYDTQYKKNTCLHLFSLSKKPREHLRILEFGFGSGALLFSFPRNCEVHGVELSTSALVRAQWYAERAGYCGFSFQRPTIPLPFPNDSMDLVFASHVLEHVPDGAAFLKETHRLLKEDAVAVLLVPINEQYDNPNHLRRYTLDSLCDQVKEVGFSVEAKIENDLLFHLVERFYYGGYKSRWGIFGQLLSIAFNVPTSLLPISVQSLCDRFLLSLGLKSRQAGVLIKKISRGPMEGG